MTTSPTPPIRPGASVVRLCDVCSVDELFNEAGQSQGLHLIWQLAEHCGVSGQSPQKIAIGQRWLPRAGQAADPQAVVCLKSLQHPQTGKDHVYAVHRNGALLEFIWDEAIQHVTALPAVQLPQASDGGQCTGSPYHLVDFVFDAATQTTQLWFAYFASDAWHLTHSTCATALPLPWADVGEILDAKITQFQLRQNIQFWTRATLGKDTDLLGAQAFESRVFSYELSTLVGLVAKPGAPCSAPPLQYDLPEPILIDPAALHSVSLLACNFDPQVNDEQLLLRYMSAQAPFRTVLQLVQIDLSEATVQMTSAFQYSWPCSSAALTATHNVLWSGPNDQYLVVPYFEGAGAQNHLAIKLISWDWGAKKFLESASVQLPLQASSHEATPLFQVSVGLHLRLLSANEAQLFLTSKTIPSPPGAYKADTRLITLGMARTDEGIHWTLPALCMSEMPVWVEGQDPISTQHLHANLSQHRALALATDWRGKSILYGAPQLTQKTLYAQIFGLYQTPPFERDLMLSEPLAALNFSDSSSNSNTVSSHATVFSNISNDAAISIWGQGLSLHVSQSWTNAKLNTTGQHFTTDIHVSSNFSREDMLHACTSSYSAWDYPIYQKSASQTPIGQVAIIIPQTENLMTLVPTTDKDFAYDQDYEIGMLLSYMEAEHKGFTQEQLLFHPISLPVLGDPSSSTTLAYNSTNTTMTSDTSTEDVSISAGESLTLDAHDPLGAYHFQNTTSYHKGSSKGSANTTDVTLTKNFGLTFTLGSVIDPLYEYEVTPLVYKHQDTHVILVKYQLNLIGVGWTHYFGQPQPVMFRPFPDTSDPLIKAYSRAIRFVKSAAEAAPLLTLHLFNNALVAALDVTCHIYEGRPKLNEAGRLTVQGQKKLASIGPFNLEAMQRWQMPFPNIAIQETAQISVELVCESAKQASQIYWGCFPYSDLKNTLLRPSENSTESPSTLPSTSLH